MKTALALKSKYAWTAIPLALASFIYFALYLRATNDNSEFGISSQLFEEGMAKCRSFEQKEEDQELLKRKRNPRFDIGLVDELAPSVLFTGATLIDGDASIQENVDIFIKNGLIVKVGKDLKDITADEVVVANGIVDMHSHMGLDSWPGTNGGSDTNEMSQSPVHPELRSLDGFDPWDIGIDIISRGVLPGSGNVMGGEAYPFKHRRLKSNRAEHMLLNAGMNKTDGHQWRYMKMACGENPIGYGRRRQLTPESRLGEGFLFRQRINQAYLNKQKQDEWCLKASHAQNNFGENAHRKVSKKFPIAIEHESLVALLRGEVLLNAHCYETYDLEMMVRLAKEFGFKISAFHHALEAWEVAELLAENDIGAAIFADHWGYKKEAYDASVKGAAVLAAKGVKVAFKSDHPVLNAQNLVYEAAKAVHYGLAEDVAFKSVTSTPASLLNQDWRIGYVRAGFDADLVIWDKHPLELAAHPIRVFIDGYSTFEHSDYKKTISTKFTPKSLKLPNTESVLKVDVENTVQGEVTYINIDALISSEVAKEEAKSKIVVEKGIVTCIGASCVTKGVEVDLKGGWVTPGLISVQSKLGLEEISAEADATSAGDYSVGPPPASADGVQLGLKYSKMLKAAWKAGYTTSISSLPSRGSVGAISTAIRLGSPVTSSSAFIQRNVAQNFVVGNSAKQAITVDSNVPGQLERIRSVLKESKVSVHTFDVDSSSQIYPVLELALNGSAGIIVGGAEAYVLANDIAKRGFSVVLDNPRCTPSTWYSRDCLVSGTSPSSFQQLKDAKVRVGIASKEDNFVRGGIWEAAWLVSDLQEFEKMSEFDKAKETVALLTWNLAAAYKLSSKIGVIEVGRKPNFVVFDGAPHLLSSTVKLVVDGELIETDTEQF